MSTTSTSASKPTTGWQPPSLEEMQAMLPQYQFECLLGRGGMGAVYKALQVSLDRAVAIKVLPGDLIDNEDAQFAERFKNEARTMAKMNHPSIVNVYDFGETQTGLLFIVMEFIDGTDVSKMISSQGKLPEDYALSITAHVCDALNYAHKNGVIHRDIKPANILINMDGAVKVADFGLAKQSDAGQSGLTKTNMAMGTPDFVAPEALIPGIPLDGRADLYAIGVMLYQMLTGEIPRGIWTLPGMKLGTDPRFDAIITKAMQTDRDVRYQSAAELRRDLDTILTLPRAALIAQQQAAAEAAARATQAQKQQAAAPHEPKAAATKKITSSLGPILGLAASIFLVAGLYVMFTGGGEKKTPQGGSAAPTSPPAADTATPQVAKNTPAPATTPPAPEPAMLANTSPPADLPAGAISLLAGLDVEKNKVSGDWCLVNGELVSDTGKADSEINLPAISVPSECDIRYRLSRTGGFQMQFRTPFGVFNTDGWTGNKGNNDEIILKWQGASNNKQITRNGKLLQSGAPQELLLQFRREHITVLLDGQEVLGGIPPASSPNSTGFSLRVARGKVTFHSIHIVPVAGALTPTVASTPQTPPAPPQPAPVASMPAAMSSSPATPTTVAVETSAADLKSGAIHTFGGHRYQLFEESLLWDAAKARAESMGGHLATITSKEEREWLANSLSPLKGTRSHVYLGGYRAPEGGSWSWVTKEPFDVSLWPGGVPTTTDTHLAFYIDNVAWDDVPADLKSPFLVEWDWAEFLAAHPQLGKLESGFRSRYESDAQQPFLAALRMLNQSYVANGISKARAAAQAKGSLFEVTMLDAEKSLIEKGESVPTEDAAEASASLKTLRGTYRGAFAKITAERDAKAAPLYDLYLKAIDAYIAELTKAGKTTDAVNVQSLRAEIAAQKPAVAGAVAASTAAPKTTLTPAPKAPPGGGSSWRVAADYLVNNGGFFTAFKNGGTANITKPAEIPPGRFDIIEMTFERLNSVLPPAKDADFAAFNGLRDLRRAHFRPMHNGLSDAAFAFLASNSELVFLNFEGVNSLTGGVLVHIAGLKKLDYLGVQYAENFTGQGLDRIAGAASITNLEFLGSGITDEGLKAISTFKKLQAVRFTSPKVTSAGFAALANLKTLVTLTVSSTAFDDEAASMIASTPSLAALDLSSTKITDAGLARLKTLKKLTTLSLGGTTISVEAAAEFQKAMPQCRVSR